MILLTEATAPGAAAKTAITAVAVTKRSFIVELFLLMCVMLCFCFAKFMGPHKRQRLASKHLLLTMASKIMMLGSKKMIKQQARERARTEGLVLVVSVAYHHK